MHSYISCINAAQILHISHNQLSTFERFPSLPSLAELHAASNQIKFAPLAAPLAANAPHLEVGMRVCAS
jgi:hypothetical protein